VLRESTGWELQGERVVLRPLTSTDLFFFHKLNTDPFVRSHLWDDVIISEDQSREILLENERRFDQESHGLWKIVLNRELHPAGYAGLWNFFEESRPQLMYALAPDYTGKGLATEAARLVIGYTFQKLHFPHLLASMDLENIASQKVAQRLGMRKYKYRRMDKKMMVFYRVDAGEV
jgi:[ribosomal protein S5]-alanine N-acetyltransferase